MIEVTFFSPTTLEPVIQLMTEEQATAWWDMASQPIRETASFREISE